LHPNQQQFGVVNTEAILIFKLASWS